MTSIPTKPMLVSELIAKLQTMKQDLEICVNCEDVNLENEVFDDELLFCTEVQECTVEMDGEQVTCVILS